jgi:hypothetical protein
MAGKNVMVESPEPDPNNLQNRDPRSDEKAEHINGHSQEVDRCSRPVAENPSEIMPFASLDGTLPLGAWR